MPGRDGTGPEGKGSKTGRGLGNCSDEDYSKKSKPSDFELSESRNPTRVAGRGRRNRGRWK
ncbi:MAG: DUF5320 domain-containing protein [Promethearchaeota archaeon]